ncbi:MAG TPA: UDP-N-acetylglucosamine 2-epimerase (non-hydrolyzing) [Catalimonadaceae bacterium]|nr:UDP-N-acetylglucosamine 2-epimerase (non-hydrolyzing) [Catalimonadaceae bacterium]
MPFTIFTIVGARPQFIKAAAVSRAIRNLYSSDLTEFIVHTGQHYDSDMSDVFFEELEIPKPAFHLHVGSASHGAQTASMMTALETLFLNEKPDLVLVYGDTNSTLAGALSASKIQIPVVHVEAGLRSFNKAMPEEINRILTDHVSTLLFTPTQTGVENLKREGFGQTENTQVDANHPLVVHSGDVMYDNALYFRKLAEEKANDWFRTLGADNGFILATIHRNANTDDPNRLKSLLTGLSNASKYLNQPVFLPLHPRTLKMIQQFGESDAFFTDLASRNIRILPPASYLQMVLLEARCTFIMTDSGGVQKEAYFYRKPCLVLRPETEWVELVQSGAAILVDADEKRMQEAVAFFSNQEYPAPDGFYGDGKSAEFICGEILQMLKSQKDSANCGT